MIARKKQNRRKPQRLSQRFTKTVRQERDHGKVIRQSFALFGMMAIFGCIAVTTWFAGKLADPETLPIQHVRVEGDFQYLSRPALQAVIEEKVNAGFFTLDVVAMREAVLAMPWVQEVTVRKLWPDSVSLNITEQKPVVQWGERAYLNQRGELFSPEDGTGPNGLIRLSGPEGTHHIVYEKYRKLMGLLSSHDRTISWMALNDRRGWRFGLSDGPTVVIGNKDVDTRIWRYLNHVEAVLGDQADRFAQIDLRYSNGFTVKAAHQAPEAVSEANATRAGEANG